jgi:hypothetical protein
VSVSTESLSSGLFALAALPLIAAPILFALRHYPAFRARET